MNGSTHVSSAQILDVSVEALNMELALAEIRRELEAKRQGYVCMVGVHGIMEAHRSPELVRIYSAATMTIPDGAPTVWVGHLQGQKQMRRVAGPELMFEIFASKEFGRYTHFLYGGKEGVAEDLRRRLTQLFPWVRIVGTYTPPFRDLNVEEEKRLLAMVHELRPDILWVGISTPKQERFMQAYLHRLDATLMFGVGAAFDFHTGRIKDAPDWVKKIGMQWMHRLLQDPRHLWRRYLRNNPAFMWHIALQLTGLRRYPPAPPREVAQATIQTRPAPGRS